MESRPSLFRCLSCGVVLFAAATLLLGCNSSGGVQLRVLTSLNPSSAPAGGPGFTLRVTGTGFQNTDVVLWNGMALATKPAGDPELDAQVPANLIASPGSATITVSGKPFGAGAASNGVQFTISPGGPTAANLTITKTHSGNFTQGQSGATYTITVSNSGSGSTSGTVTVTDTVPAGLAATAASGTGWTCTISVTCTRNDPLATDSSYPSITLTVNVASNAPSSVTNMVTVSGGGDPNNHTANDATTVTAPQVPDLTIAKTHTGNFTQGQTGATYAITASNAGTGPTVGTVTVTDTLPVGLTATAISGSGWTCSVGSLTCTRSDALAAGSGYPAITLTVTVAANAPSSVTNTAVVSGGGETNTTNDTANDPTTINSAPIVANQITMGGADSFAPFVYSDPLISFSSLAADLVPNDTNGQLDVFVACVVGGAVTNCPTPITRVSLTSAGAQIPAGAGPSPSTSPVSPTPISGDGRFIVFASADPNVVTLPTPNNGALEIYVRDTCFGAMGCTPTTFLASVNSAGTIAGSQNSQNPSISSNGRVIAFFSGDFNLAPPASGFQIYARDTCFGAPAGCAPRTILVSADNAGMQGNVFSNNPSVSGDGRFVAFESNSNNLVPTATMISQQVFLRDTCIGASVGCAQKTLLVSANQAGSPSNNASQNASISSDGRFVLFTSQSSDILPGNTAAGSPDVFLRDTCGGTAGPVAGCTPSTTRVSVAFDGSPANGVSISGTAGTSMSTTGRFVAFGSLATNLLSTPSAPGQVYVVDTCIGAPVGCMRTVHKVTVDSNGNEIGSSGQIGLSGDGKYLAFTKLVGTAPNQIQQIFLALTGFSP